jgi:hypothetical protein
LLSKDNLPMRLCLRLDLEEKKDTRDDASTADSASWD